jgi:type I restriction enzyme, S subunit
MWIESPLSDLATITSGGTPAREIPSYWGGSIPWVTPSDITACSRNVLTDTRERISPKGLAASAARLVPAESILLTSRATVGEARMAGVSVCTNQGFKCLTPKAVVDPWFLFYQVQRCRGLFERFAAGSTFLEIGKRDTERIKISRPASVEKQRRIAKVLATIDTAIEATEALIEKHQQIKAGLMHDLFTRGVLGDGSLRPTVDVAPDLYRNTRIGVVPGDWSVVRMHELASDRPGSTTIGPFGSNLVANDYRRSGVPITFVRDIKAGRYEWNSDTYVTGEKARQLRAHSVDAGDVIATKMGVPPCVSCVYPEWMPAGVITADVIRLTPNRLEVSAVWLAEAVNQDRVKRQVAAITAGVTRAKVTLADFRKITLAKPPRSEQDAIAERAEAIEAEIELERQKVSKLRAQKLGLMQDLLTGKVRVPLPSSEVTV